MQLLHTPNMRWQADRWHVDSATLSPMLQNLLAVLRGSRPQCLRGADAALLRGDLDHGICSTTSPNVDQVRCDPHRAHPGDLR